MIDVGISFDQTSAPMNRWCSSGHPVKEPDDGGAWNRGDNKVEPEPIRFYRVTRAKGKPEP